MLKSWCRSVGLSVEKSSKAAQTYSWVCWLCSFDHLTGPLRKRCLTLSCIQTAQANSHLEKDMPIRWKRIVDHVCFRRWWKYSNRDMDVENGDSIHCIWRRHDGEV